MDSIYTYLMRAAIAVCYILITSPFVFTAITRFLPYCAKARTLDAPLFCALPWHIAVGTKQQ